VTAALRTPLIVKNKTKQNKNTADIIIRNVFLSFNCNIRNASKNLTKLDNHLSNLGHPFKIIAVSESWLRKNNKVRYYLDGYNSEYNVRESRFGGGVSRYIQKFFK